jgi:chromate transport protein ChrA
MSLKIIIIGVLLQLCFAFCQFLAAVFWSSAIANKIELEGIHGAIINSSLLVLPAISVVTCILMVALYLMDSEHLTNWIHLFPVITFALYIAYSTQLR